MRRAPSPGPFLSDNDGATAAEFAIISPVLLAFLLGIIGCGQMLWTQNTLQYAVEQAARCAAIAPSTCGTSAQIQSYAVSKAPGLSGLTTNAFAVGSASCGKTVSASLPYAILKPISISVTLNAFSCRPT